MRKRYTIALSVLVGMVTGVAGPYVVHSQEEQPVYMIALNEVTNPDGYKNEYLPPAQVSIKEYGGTYVVAGLGTPIEGTLPHDRIVVLRWANMAALQRWRTSPGTPPRTRSAFSTAKSQYCCGARSLE